MSVGIVENGEIKTICGELYKGETIDSRRFPGEITMAACNKAPAGWLICDGSTFSVNSYPALYAAIGRLYTDESVPSGKFSLPDMRGRYALGVGDKILGEEVEESVPNIKGRVYGNSGHNAIQGCFNPKFEGAYSSSKLGSSQASWRDNTSQCFELVLDASQTSSGNGKAYKDGAKVRPDSIVLNYFIKY